MRDFEIGGHSKSDDQAPCASKRQQAILPMQTKIIMPVAAHLQLGASVRKNGGASRRRAKSNVATMVKMPADAPSEFPGDGERAGAMIDLSASMTMPQPEKIDAEVKNHQTADASASVSALTELQRQRQFCIKSQSRCDRSCEAFIARYLGYRPDLPEAEGDILWKQARAMRRAVEKGGHVVGDNQSMTAPLAGGEGQASAGNHKIGALSACTPIILNSAASRLAWDKHRANVERQMRKLAAALPVAPWASTIEGFGELGLAILIGEAGDLSLYATKERVWKRLGLAVIEGERQRRKAGAEAAAAHGYSPERRAEVWAITDSMFKHQWRGEKDNAPAHPVGPYGAVYARRKAHTVTREGWCLKHRDNDARRIMAKALVEDLWRTWNGKPALAVAV